MRSCTSSLPASAIATGRATCAIPPPSLYDYRRAGLRTCTSTFTGTCTSVPIRWHNGSVKRRWEIPQGLHVCPDGSWRVGEYHVIHPPSLRYFKSHLVQDNGGAAVIDGEQRIPIT